MIYWRHTMSIPCFFVPIHYLAVKWLRPLLSWCSSELSNTSDYSVNPQESLHSWQDPLRKVGGNFLTLCINLKALTYNPPPFTTLRHTKDEPSHSWGLKVRRYSWCGWEEIFRLPESFLDPTSLAFEMLWIILYIADRSSFDYSVFLHKAIRSQ